MTILIALVVSIILFTKINIYGFFIGVSGVVIVLTGILGSKQAAKTYFLLLATSFFETV